MEGKSLSEISYALGRTQWSLLWKRRELNLPPRRK
jgi:hypothetical protein